VIPVFGYLACKQSGDNKAGWATTGREKKSAEASAIEHKGIIMSLLETERLAIRQLTEDDAAFILELLNEPSFIQNIADRGVRTLDDAVQYIVNGPRASYERNGFGLFMVELKDSGVPIGMCGLIKRDSLEDVDIGYALLPRFWSQGYAYEAASAVMDYGCNVLNIPRIVGITAPDNQGSIRVLEKLGLRFDKIVVLQGVEGESMLFVP
jgi:[ribosomal protein S5]-alanine N-acetyltransferase